VLRQLSVGLLCDERDVDSAGSDASPVCPIPSMTARSRVRLGLTSQERLQGMLREPGPVIHGSDETTDGLDIDSSLREENLRRPGLALPLRHGLRMLRMQRGAK
jgi:hypothetical protein